MRRAIGYVGYVLIAVDIALLIRAIRSIGGDCRLATLVATGAGKSELENT